MPFSSEFHYSLMLLLEFHNIGVVIFWLKAGTVSIAKTSASWQSRRACRECLGIVEVICHAAKQASLGEILLDTSMQCTLNASILASLSDTFSTCTARDSNSQAALSVIPAFIFLLLLGSLTDQRQELRAYPLEPFFASKMPKHGLPLYMLSDLTCWLIDVWLLKEPFSQLTLPSAII